MEGAPNLEKQDSDTPVFPEFQVEIKSLAEYYAALDDVENAAKVLEHTGPNLSAEDLAIAESGIKVSHEALERYKAEHPEEFKKERTH